MVIASIINLRTTATIFRKCEVIFRKSFVSAVSKEKNKVRFCNKQKEYTVIECRMLTNNFLNLYDYISWVQKSNYLICQQWTFQQLDDYV